MLILCIGCDIGYKSEMWNRVVKALVNPGSWEPSSSKIGLFILQLFWPKSLIDFQWLTGRKREGCLI